jgi:hypothetical protein
MQQATPHTDCKTTCSPNTSAVPSTEQPHVSQALNIPTKPTSETTHLCVPSVSAGNLATSPVPGTFSQRPRSSSSSGKYLLCYSSSQCATNAQRVSGVQIVQDELKLSAASHSHASGQHTPSLPSPLAPCTVQGTCNKTGPQTLPFPVLTKCTGSAATEQKQRLDTMQDSPPPAACAGHNR